MNIASETVTLDDGTTAMFSDLVATDAIALVFLRHFGCVFCRRQVSLMRSHPHFPLYFVCQETHESAADFRRTMRSPHRFICDPDGKLYDLFGMRRGTSKQLVNARTIGGALLAMLHGSFQGKPTADPTQLGGWAVVSQDGSVYMVHAAIDAADLLTPDQARSILQEEFAVTGIDEPGPVESPPGD